MAPGGQSGGLTEADMGKARMREVRVRVSPGERGLRRFGRGDASDAKCRIGGPTTLD